MAGNKNDESYYEKGVVIEYKKSFQRFDLSEPGKHLSQHVIKDEDVRLVEMDDIWYKIEMSTFNRNKIEVSSCKDLKDEQLDPPDEVTVKDLVDIFAEDKTVNIWLNENHDPMYVSLVNSARLLDMSKYKTADKLNLKDLVKKSTDKDFDMSRWALVSESGDLYYLRDTNTMSKLFIPFMLEWFDDRFPDVAVDKSDVNGVTISKLGFRMLLQMFIFSAHGFTNTSPVTFQANSEFDVSIPELMESPIGGGIQLRDGQLKNLVHMLPVRAKVPSSDRGFFDKSILSDPDNIKISFTEHVKCTWYTFISAMEMFPSSCTIHLAPGQIIVDEENDEVFSEFDVVSILYRGPNFILPEEQNTMQVVVKGDSIDTGLRTRMISYFEQNFDLPITAWRLERSV